MSLVTFSWLYLSHSFSLTIHLFLHIDQCSRVWWDPGKSQQCFCDEISEPQWEGWSPIYKNFKFNLIDFFFSRKSKVKELLKNKYQEDKIYAGTDVNNHECFGEYLKILI